MGAVTNHRFSSYCKKSNLLLILLRPPESDEKFKVTGNMDCHHNRHVIKVIKHGQSNRL